MQPRHNVVCVPCTCAAVQDGAAALHAAGIAPALKHDTRAERLLSTLGAALDT